MNIRAALKYQLAYIAWSSLFVYGISLLVIAGLSLFVTVNNGNMQTNLAPIAFIHFLVIGASGIREDLRFFLQHGTGRRTTFLSSLYGSIISSLAISLFIMIFDMIFGFFQGSYEFFAQAFISDLIFYFLMLFSVWHIGTLISLIYYRLNKVQQRILTALLIGAGILIFSSGISFIVFNTDFFTAWIEWVINSAENQATVLSPAIFVFLLGGAISAAVSYFLIIKAQIKDA
jgi:hypothetical protein